MKTISITVDDTTLDLARALVEAEKAPTQGEALAYILRVGTGRVGALHSYARKVKKYAAATEKGAAVPLFRPYAALHVPKVEAQRTALKTKAARVLAGLSPKRTKAERAPVAGGEGK